VLLEGREDDEGKNTRGRKEERRNHLIVALMINLIHREGSNTFHRTRTNSAF
jgi:hypothetical protein